MSRLSGKTCVVTGAAGGIGSAIARRAVGEGAAVVVSDLNGQGIEALAAEIEAGGGKAVAVRADVTDRAAMEQVAQAAVDSFGSLDVLFNNAGIPVFAPLDEITADIFRQAMMINAYGVVVGTQVAARAMQGQTDGGKIVNTCSVAGKHAYPEHTVYAATKFAVRAFTQGFAQELAGAGIRVNAICPGVVDTALWDQIASEQSQRGAQSTRADLVREYGAAIPLGRASTPEDLTGLAIFLASEDSDYMTGQCVNVDGGILFD